MTPSETAASYDRIAAHWDCPAFDRSNGIAQHERALGFVANARTALDVGCGSSGRIIDLLLRRGLEVEGLDLSQAMLARARRHHPHVRFHHADISSWTFPRRYDFISAWDSVWHVPLADQLAVLRKICDGLAANGVFIFTTGGVDAPEDLVVDNFGAPLYHAAPGIPAVLRTLDAAGCVCRHLEYDQPRHVFLIAQRVE